MAWRPPASPWSPFPAAAEPLVEAHPAFSTPAGEIGTPRLYAAGDQAFVHLGEPGNRLYRFDPQTLAAALLGDGPLLPLGAAGDRLLVREPAANRLLAAGADGLVTLPVLEPAAPFAPGPGATVLFTDRTDGQELWQSDGTVEGTRTLTDLDPAWLTPCEPSGSATTTFHP